MIKKCYFFAACFLVMNAFAMADKTPPVYGVPTLYGEYEISPDDTRRASDMYGASSKRAAPIRAGAAKNANVAKHPVKAKKVAPKKKKAKVKKKSVTKTSVLKEQSESVIDTKTPEMVIVSVEPAPVETKSVPVASRAAVDIAAVAANKKDTESFCTQIKHQGRGNLPDGIIMMPGRPDLMSCVSNSEN